MVLALTMAQLEDRSPIPYFVLYAVFLTWYAVSAIVEHAQYSDRAYTPPHLFAMCTGVCATLGQAYILQGVSVGERLSRRAAPTMLFMTGTTWAFALGVGPQNAVVATPMGVYSGAMMCMSGLFTVAAALRVGSILLATAEVKAYYDD